MKQKIVFCFLVIVVLFQNSTLQAQGWERTYLSSLGYPTNIRSIVETQDSGFVFAKTTYRLSLTTYNIHYLTVVKTDKFGSLIWEYNPSNLTILDTIKVLKTSDNGFIIVTTEATKFILGLPSLLVIKLNSQGVEQFRKVYFEQNAFVDADILTENGQIHILTRSDDPRLIFGSPGGHLLQLTSNGNSIRTTFFNNLQLESIVFGGDRQAYIAYRTPQLLSEHISVMKVDSVGNRIWSKNRTGYPLLTTRLKKTNDGRILASGGWKLNYDGSTMAGGDFTYYTYNNFSNYRSGNNIVTLKLMATPPSINIQWLFVKQDSIGTDLEQSYFRHENYEFNDIMATSDSGFVVIGRLTDRKEACVIKVNRQGYIYSNTIKGKFYIDSVQNCRIDATEKGYPNRLIAIQKNNQIRWAITNVKGDYEIQVDTGNYTIQGILPNSNWRFCTPSVTKQFTDFGITDTTNFAAQAVYSCPLLRINAVSGGLRRCFDNNSYAIRYINEGTMAAQNAFIFLKLDSLLEYISATRPLISRQGQTLRFDLGTVPIGFEGQFSVQVRVRCGDSTRLGQSLCTEARIFPDTICVPAPNWSGANIVVSGRCDRDSVRFLIQNIGTATSAPLRRKIVEDEIVFLNGLISVPANGSQTISVPANGKTWQLLMEQEPNNPLSNHPTAVVEGCRLNPNQPISTGFVNQFPTDDGSPTIDNVCMQITGSYDPNDKEGLPLGYKTAHFIDQNQDIEYRIRFQNTGTDTAFTIVVRDTLSDFLDIASLKIGASSHRFNWTIDGKNVLVFRFENILLPDSFRNVAASQGFVKLKISQKKDVALGTKINNQADIYFDYNAPIRTNKTVHTIGKDFIITALQTVSPIPNVEIKVYPNPFNAGATIEIQGFDPLSIKSNFELFDALGRQIRSEKFEGNQFLFERHELPTGIYFFKIENGGRLVGTGKFLVK